MLRSIIIVKKEDIMDMNKFKRDYKFKSEQSYNDSRRNKTLIISCIVIIIVLYYLSKYI